MEKNPQDDFIIPEKFIKQLEEFSNGGFILLTFSKKGNPVSFHCYDTKKDQLALELFLDKYAEKLSRLRFEEDDEEKASKKNDEDDEDEKEEA